MKKELKYKSIIDTILWFAGWRTALDTFKVSNFVNYFWAIRWTKAYPKYWKIRIMLFLQACDLRELYFGLENLILFQRKKARKTFSKVHLAKKLMLSHQTSVSLLVTIMRFIKNRYRFWEFQINTFKENKNLHSTLVLLITKEIFWKICKIWHQVRTGLLTS